jgi:hypothetical protein
LILLEYLFFRFVFKGGEIKGKNKMERSRKIRQVYEREAIFRSLMTQREMCHGMVGADSSRTKERMNYY